jgi:hypothetical protein
MENPNEYDDAAYMRASNDLFEAVMGLWAAGASEDEISGLFDNAMNQVG